jgi:hypothetical protein
MSHHYSGPTLGSPTEMPRLDFTDLYAFLKPGDRWQVDPDYERAPVCQRETPPGPITAEPFAPEALYELKIDTDATVTPNSARGIASGHRGLSKSEMRLSNHSSS